MRWMAALAATLAVKCCCAADSLPAERLIGQGCQSVQTAAQKLFEQHGFTVTVDQCVGCYLLKSKHMETPNGHRILFTETALHRYMDTSGDGKLPPGSWIAHSPVQTDGFLRTGQIGGQCQVHLLFRYSWYAAQFVVIFPVDGDPASRPSNLRLEREYLEALAHSFDERH